MTTEVQGREHLLRRQQAMGTVFRLFAVVWPQAFAPRKLDQLLGVWLDNCADIPDDMLEPAARAMLRQKQRYPPKPFDFAQFARRIVRQRTGAATRQDAAPTVPSWQWVSPRSNRVVFVEERPDGWVWSSGMDDPSDFLAMNDAGKRAYCDERAIESPVSAEYQQAR